ncbi:MAG: recombinase family protein [Defluviitaleaceae bacterium]|nr:recombinase family protein [Defluviitaleaceae bacterium]
MARAKKINTADTRRVAVYVRKSKITESGKSIEIQKEKCIALACAQFDVTETEISIYEDEGKSGFYADRPQYKQMLRDIENNKVRAVVCYKIDRISRRTIDLLNLIQQMDQKGIAFVSVSDRELDTSSRTGKIMIALLSAIAEFERDIIAERITDNMYELAKEGRWLGGECPLGYSSKKEKLTINGRKSTINHLEPVSDEQLIVKRLYKLFLQKGSYNATFTALNNEGFRTKKGRDFTSIAVKNILQNPVYAIADKEMKSYFTSFDVTIWADESAFDGKQGMMAYNKTEQTKEIDQDSRALDPKYTQKSLRRDIKDWIVSVGKHEGIISGEDWIRVQTLMADISKDNAARPKETSKALLSGLVRCIDCGSRMFVRAEGGRYNPDGSVRFRYVCDVKYRKKGTCENSPNVKGYDLDTFVVEQLSNISRDHNLLHDQLFNAEDALQLTMKTTEKEIISLRKRLSQIEQDIQSQISNLRTAPENLKQNIYADVGILNQERDEKQSRLDVAISIRDSQENQIAEIAKMSKVIKELPNILPVVDYEGKLQLLRLILECVLVKGDKVHIFLKGMENSPFFVKGQERSDVCHTEELSILNTTYRIRRKPHALIGFK